MTERSLRGGIQGGKNIVNCVRVCKSDNVATLIQDLSAGAELVGKGVPSGIKLRSRICFGHKAALSEIRPGEGVIKYGEIIGCATEQIFPGEHVHVHNIESGRGRGDLG